MIPAHACVKLPYDESLRIRTPSASVGPPKYSPTIAPIIDSTVATFSPVKRCGREFGMRTRRNCEIRPAAYDCISSIAEGWTEVRPRSVLIITGKKHRTATIAILENGFSNPNQSFMIGANAMIGIALAATAYGMNV